MRIKIFGSLKKAKGYKYQSIVREVAAQTIEENSDSDSEDDSKAKDTQKTSYPRPPYFKAKMNLNWETSDITTKMFKLVDGKRNKTPVKTLEDVEKLVTYMSTIRMVLMPNKLWALKTFDGKKYGLSFKSCTWSRTCSKKIIERIFWKWCTCWFDEEGSADDVNNDDDNDMIKSIIHQL